jgi:BASS family bile acid:Na+ symporter
MATLLGPVSNACVILFLVSVMLSIGLEVTVKELVSTLHQRRLLIKAFIGNFVLTPLLGILIVSMVHLPVNVEEGLLLLAVAPGALFSINFTRQMKDSTAVAASLLFLFAAISLVLTSSLADVILHIELPVTLDYGKAIQVLSIYVALPLFGGLALRRWAAPVAVVLRKPAAICAGIFFVLVTVSTMTLKSASTKKIGGNGLIALCLLIAGGMAIGWISGGPQSGTRRVLVVSTSMRNVALCLAIAQKSFPGMDVDVPVIAFSALMLPPNLLFTLYHARKAKKLSALPAGR